MAAPFRLCAIGLLLLQRPTATASPVDDNGTSDATVELTVGVLLPFVVDYSLLAFVALWDLDFRKQFEPELVERFGPPIFPIPEASRFPGLRVRITTGETGVNEAIGVWSAQSLLYGKDIPPDEQARGIVGIVNSVVAMPVATYLAANPTPLIATGVGASSLSNKERFPYFFRLNADSAVAGLFMWLYFEYFDFKSCSWLYVAEEFSSSHYETFMRHAMEAKRDDAVHAVSVPYVLTNSTADHDNWLYAVNSVKGNRARLVMTVVPLGMVTTLQVFLLGNGLCAPEYQTLSSTTLLSMTEFYPQMTGSHIIYPYMNTSEEKLTRMWDMYFKMNATDVLSQSERYGLDRWFPDERFTFKPSRMTDAIFKEVPNQISASLGVLIQNALHMYYWTFSELLVSGVPPEQVRGEVLRQKLRTMGFDGFGGYQKFDANQDGLSNFTVMSYTIEDKNGTWVPTYSPLCTFSMGLVNDTKTFTLRPTGLPAVWANRAVSTAAPSELTSCPPGQYQAAPRPNSSKDFGTCVDCQLGRFTNNSNELECHWCPAGKYGLANRHGCADCLAGTYNPDRGASSCSRCNVGSAQPSAGGSSCELCPLGRYADERSLTECKPCQTPQEGPLRTTDSAGASSPEACFCPEGFYEGLLGECASCDPESLACPVGTSLLPQDLGRHSHRPAALPGFMLMPEMPADAYRCTPSQHCPGGLPGNCSGGRVGVACGECPEGQIALTGDCRDCRQGDHAAVVLLAIGLMFFAFGMYYATNGYSTNRAVATIGCSSSLSTTLMAVQVIGLFDRLSLPFPNMASKFVHASAVASVDITSVVPLSCIVGRTSFWSYFLTVCVFPMVICILLYFLLVSWLLVRKGYVREGSRLEWHQDKVHNSMGVFLQALFIIMSTIAATPMMCYKHPNGKQSVMRYPQVICGEENHSGMLAAGVMLMLFAIAFVSYASLLVVEAPRLQQLWGNKAFFRRTRFLVLLYRVDRMYWGLLVMLRSLVLSFIPVWAPDSPRVQQMILSTVLIVYTPLMCGKWPWKIPAMNILDAITCTVILTIVLVAGMYNAPPSATEARAFEVLINASVVMVYAMNGLVILVCVGAVLFRGRYADLHPCFLLQGHPRRDELCRRFLEVSQQLNFDQTSKPGSFEKSVKSWQHHDLVVLREIVEVLASNGIASSGGSPKLSLSRATSDQSSTLGANRGSSRWSDRVVMARGGGSGCSQDGNSRVKWQPSVDSVDDAFTDIDDEELVLKVSASGVAPRRDAELIA